MHKLTQDTPNIICKLIDVDKNPYTYHLPKKMKAESLQMLSGSNLIVARELILIFASLLKILSLAVMIHTSFSSRAFLPNAFFHTFILVLINEFNNSISVQQTILVTID